jgi:hypothetical protein
METFMSGNSPETMPQPAAPQAESRMRMSTVLKTGAVLGFGGLIGYSASGHNGSPLPEVTPATAEDMHQVSVNCNTGMELSNHWADTKFGAPESMFPALSTDKENHTQLFTKEKASETLKEQMANDDRVLAVFYTFFIETREKEQLPDAGTLGRAQTLEESYRTNKDLAAKHLAQACEAVTPELLVPTKSFAVTKGQAMEVQTDRDHQTGHVNGFHSEKVPTTNNLEGFQVSFVEDDATLTAEQKSIFRKLQSLLLVTKKGTIVTNLVFGESSIKVDQHKNVTPATIRKGNRVIHVNIMPNGSIVPASPKEKLQNLHVGQQSEQQQQSQSQNQSNAHNGGGGSGKDKGHDHGNHVGGGNHNANGHCGGCGSGTGGGAGGSGGQGGQGGSGGSGGSGGGETGGSGCSSCGGSGCSSCSGTTPTTTPTQTQTQTTPTETQTQTTPTETQTQTTPTETQTTPTVKPADPGQPGA